jgi:hypothetical protein
MHAVAVSPVSNNMHGLYAKPAVLARAFSPAMT